MNILLINTITVGGAAHACLRLFKSLQEAGVTVNVLTLNDDKPESNIFGYRQYLRKNGKYIELVGGLLSEYGQKALNELDKDIETFTRPRSFYRLHQHPLVQEADLINLHWVSHMFDYPTFFRHIKKPIVWTLHDVEVFNGGNPYLTTFPYERYKNRIKRNIKIKAKALQHANLTIVTPSRWLLNLSQQSKLLNRFDHHLVPYGIDTTVFKPLPRSQIRKELNLPLDKKIVLFVAHRVQLKRKGFTYLLAALRQLAAKDVLLCAVGGEQGSIDLPNIPVKNIARIADAREMAKWFAAVDLFVIPSLEDNLPNTVIESISCGTPVVGFAVGGIPDMVVEGKNGLLSKEVTATALATTIEKALGIEWNRKLIRADALARYEEQIQGEKYLTIFKSLVNS